MVSLRAPGSTVDVRYPAPIDGAYRAGSGTSMAAAVTSGAAALLRQAHPAWTPDQVKGALLATALVPITLIDLEHRITELRASKGADKDLLAEYESQAQQLGTAEALATGNTSVIRTPTTADATKIRPRPFRDAVLAGAIGLLLGIVAAFLRDAVDTRIRAAEEIGDRLGVPLLARVSEPPRPLQMSDGLVMLADPNGR